MKFKDYSISYISHNFVVQLKQQLQMTLTLWMSLLLVLPTQSRPDIFKLPDPDSKGLISSRRQPIEDNGYRDMVGVPEKRSW